MDLTKKRCSWCNLKNPLYVAYHDEEWGKPCHDDRKLYELFILETFQAGLSWECILNKRENFRRAYDGFELEKVCSYDEEKIETLMQDAGIIRNRAKIRASIVNSRIFREIVREYGSFDAYLMSFSGGKIIFESAAEVTTSALSDALSADLKRRGMSFVGSTTIYAFLQAAGIINAHSGDCFCYEEEKMRPQAGETWRHFKGKRYRIVALAEHSETGEEMVVYQALYGEGKVWVRPLKMFMEKVDREKYPDVTQEWRFVKE